MQAHRLLRYRSRSIGLNTQKPAATWTKLQNLRGPHRQQVANIAIEAKRVPSACSKLLAIFHKLDLDEDLHLPDAMARDHRKLDAFKLADKMAIAVYLATADFPKSETYGLRSQVRRAAVSIPTNIVEGCARESEPDYLRFLDIALGSARETVYLIDLARRLSMLDASEAQPVEALGDRVAGALVNLRRSLKS
jgi:four helix bundle protein